MDAKSRFFALEVLCRERARLADNEANYWLAEAEDWARFALSCDQRRPDQSKPGYASAVKVGSA